MYRAQDFRKLRLERFLSLLAVEAAQVVGATLHLKPHFHSLVPGKPADQQVRPPAASGCQACRG